MSSQRLCSIEQVLGIQETLGEVTAAEHASGLRRFQSFREGDITSCVDTVSPAFSVLAATNKDKETGTHQVLNGIIVPAEHVIIAMGSLYLQLDDEGRKMRHFQFVTGYDATAHKAEAEFEGLLRDRSTVQITGASKRKYGLAHAGFKIGRTREGCFTVCHLPDSVVPVDIYHVRPGEEKSPVLDVFEDNPDGWKMTQEFIESDVMRPKKQRVQNHERVTGKPRPIKRMHGRKKAVHMHRHPPRTQ